MCINMDIKDKLRLLKRIKINDLEPSLQTAVFNFASELG